ncbi:hypothetical protein ACDT10_01885 [Mycobacterium intracellulare]|uniref:hypothetical protein n=1 Tax=Mycobacterium intracellulare TaxID=1767 RepID=UPI0035574CC9
MPTAPAGVEVAVRAGFAIIDFTDPDQRGPALAKLIDIGGGESIESFTRGTPRKVYRVPEGNAREAGLLDDSTLVEGLTPAADTGFAAALAAAGHQQPPTLTGQRAPEQPDLPHDTALQAPGDYPDGAPDADWTRAELDAYALDVKHIDTIGLPNKAAVLDAIRKGN